ncbi:hypothetical protein [Desulfosporosinus shakirovi]|uniref:hypothetical protein n=1 Tax=Desulfosporosinus shakirovi TaxID=2885154 RepID=UPI001E3E9A10|nr:hypothetical protein [Desulfosporosinus sp. SRJS8]MCB8817865.1 hypothetical protein [Desulfosporosinus sp. SRJS8]
MEKSMFQLKSKTEASLRHKVLKGGDRVKTSNHHNGVVVRVDRDENGVFIVVRLDVSPHEFVYDPDEIKVIWQRD